MEAILDQMRRLAREIAQLKRLADAVLALRQGFVTSVTGTTLTVTIGGSTTTVSGIRWLTPYSATNTPSAGDTVWIVRNGADLIVLGELS